MFGDWISEPGPLPWNSSLSSNDEGASGQILAGYNFVKDLRTYSIRPTALLGPIERRSVCQDRLRTDTRGTQLTSLRVFVAHSAGTVSEMAGWLGKTADAEKYNAAHAKFQGQFHDVYWNSTRGCYGSWTLYGCHERACACGQASNSVRTSEAQGKLNA